MDICKTVLLVDLTRTKQSNVAYRKTCHGYQLSKLVRYARMLICVSEAVCGQNLCICVHCH